MAAVPVAFWFMAAAAAVQTIGQVQQGKAAAAAGKAEQQALDYRASVARTQARALEQEAGQERARAQRAAMDERRQGQIISSRARALGAASGAAIDTNILGDIDLETERRTLEALASGEEQARGLEYRAALARSGATADTYAGSFAASAGQAARQRANLAAAGTILSTGAGMYSQYAAMAPAAQAQPQAGTALSYPWSV